jgi:hypothetical protein
LGTSRPTVWRGLEVQHGIGDRLTTPLGRRLDVADRPHGDGRCSSLFEALTNDRSRRPGQQTKHENDVARGRAKCELNLANLMRRQLSDERADKGDVLGRVDPLERETSVFESERRTPAIHVLYDRVEGSPTLVMSFPPLFTQEFDQPGEHERKSMFVLHQFGLPNRDTRSSFTWAALAKPAGDKLLRNVGNSQYKV